MLTLSEQVALRQSLPERAGQLEALREGFAKYRIGVLSGPTGIGKTFLAKSFAYTYRDLFPGSTSYSPNPYIPTDHGLGFFGVARGAERGKWVPAKALTIMDEAHRLSCEQIAYVSQGFRSNSLLLVTQQPLTLTEPHFVLQLTEMPGGDFRVSGVVDHLGRPLPLDSARFSQIVDDISAANDQLLSRLHSDPSLWYSLEPRRFEELIADMLVRDGYTVQLTPKTRDGGVDIWAAQKALLGDFLFLVECKRYSPRQKVGVHLVRSLCGVLADHRATGAALITTSYFTRGAIDLQSHFKHQLKLSDYLDLQAWLLRIRQREG